MIKNIFLICFLFGNAMAFSEEVIANSLKKQAILGQIDSKILYTLAKIESNFNPLIISFTHSHTNFDFKNLKKKVSRYKNKYLLSFTGAEKDLQEALKILIRQGIRVDAGLMQINSVNFNENEIAFIFKPAFNIEKSTFVLKQCIASKSKIKDSIECYNKGMRKVTNFDYYERFKKHYLKDFGGII